MTATNHIITGAVIAGVVRQPMLVLPLALFSHMVLDALPHFGFPDWDKARRINRRLINSVITIDVVLVALLLGLFAVNDAPTLFYVAGLAAFSPDLAWVYQFIVYHRLEQSKDKPHGGFNAFHENLQSRERPSGIYIELGYLAAMVLLLVRIWP